MNLSKLKRCFDGGHSMFSSELRLSDKKNFFKLVEA